jgi:hypothetical protein
MRIVCIAGLTMMLAMSVSGLYASEGDEYWDNGQVRVSNTYNEEGGLADKVYYDEHGVKQREEKYNDLGEKILLAYFGKDGGLRTGSDGWACMKWKYQAGNMIGEGYYGDDGKLIEYKRYNEEGDLVDKKYFGGRNPDPSEEYGTVPTIAGETMEYYDKEGKEEGSTGITYDDDFFPYLFSED